MVLTDETFSPLHMITLPTEEDIRHLATLSCMPAQDMKDRFEDVTKKLGQWLETAHMITFTIEQSVKRGDNMDSHTVQPLESMAVNTVQPLIRLLSDTLDEIQQEQDEDIQDMMSMKLSLTKVQSEWSGLQQFIVSVKNLIDASNEKIMLRRLMENILLQIDDLSIMIFQFQEKKHIMQQQQQQVDTSAVTIATSIATTITFHAGATNKDANSSVREDGILLEIDNRVGPLFNNVEKVFNRMTSPDNPPEDSTGLLTRKHLLVQERWELLRLEIDELKAELKEDRWLAIFNQVADQVDNMMNGLNKTVDQCYLLIQQILKQHQATQGGNGYSLLSSLSATTHTTPSSSSSSSSSATTTIGNAISTPTDLREKLRSVEKNFEAKYKYYTPSISKMLTMLGNGIASRVTQASSSTIFYRHEEMLTKWNALKNTMDNLRRRELPEIMGYDTCSNFSDQSSSIISGWSRLSDRSSSDSNTTSSFSRGTPTPRNNHSNKYNRSLSPSIGHVMEESNSLLELTANMARSKSPFNNGQNRMVRSSPSPLFIDEQRHRAGLNDNSGRKTSTASPINGYYSSREPINASPSSITTRFMGNQLYMNKSVTTNNMRRQQFEDDGDDDIRQFLTPNNVTTTNSNGKQQQFVTSTTNMLQPPRMLKRSVTPNILSSTRHIRSNTPSFIPRPRTPNSKKMDSMRPRSSMARMNNTKLHHDQQQQQQHYFYKPDPKDPLDKAIALIVNRSPIPIQCSKKTGTAGDGKYFFGNELTPSLGGGKKIYTCKLMTYENSGRSKVLIRVGGGWQDLEIFLLEHTNLIG
ncbi:hypothetical protein BDF20DRAFT_986987 [Mycotypha africana]|uniref:uncharacterized protein n=1 Tax=Mycotypha africana TaxID=64632 RepID=UPI0023001402|nr:uncharacterized protein BDF20DRAFT_986987 [Mycotypha africana]KAI8982025.1 hypothetical protein BDF20DRAFT_986987 [Mycotypha africana]